MADELQIFQGDASLTTQIDTLTPGGTIEVGDEFDSILTAEDGSTQTEKYVATGTSVQSVVEGVQAQNAASAKSLFQDITWTENDLVTTATAKVAGRPFYLTEATFESGGGAADQQTYAQATTTANSGPNDWNTAANWSEGTVPVDTQKVVLAGTNVSIKYGLDQNTINLRSFTALPSYGGEVGDSIQGFYLRINTDHVSPELVQINNVNGRPIWLKGKLDNINIVGTSRELNAVQLDLESTNSETLRVSGANVRGTITVKGSSSLTNVFMNDCPNAKVVLGTAISGLLLIEMSAGNLTNDSTVIGTGSDGVVNVAGGVYKHTEGKVSTLNLRGNGIVDWRAGEATSSGTVKKLVLLNIYSGFFDMRQLEVLLFTITTAIMWGGTIDDRNGLDNVVYTNGIVRHGGTANTTTADVKAF